MGTDGSGKFPKYLRGTMERLKRMGFLHILLWIGYSFLFFYGPSIVFDTQTALLMTFRAIVFNAFVFYANTLLLLPFLLEKQHYISYGASVLVVIVTISVIFYATDPLTDKKWEKLSVQGSSNVGLYLPSPHKSETEYKPTPTSRVSPHNLLKGDVGSNILMRSLGFSIINSLGILFISTLYWINIESRRKEKMRLSLRNQNLQTEMKFLKSQINPHFLFNALNNIYSLSQSSSSKTPLLVLKLSSMLRFLLYESDEKKIALSKEINYIKDYIEFQKVKLEEAPNLQTDFQQDSGLMIEPMLLFPFVENAFKHSNIDDPTKGWIRISLKTSGHKVLFKIANSKSAGPVSKGKEGGIGVDNVRKRLSFLYAGSHHLSISETPDYYEVNLEIDTL